MNPEGLTASTGSCSGTPQEAEWSNLIEGENYIQPHFIICTLQSSLLKLYSLYHQEFFKMQTHYRKLCMLPKLRRGTFIKT